MICSHVYQNHVPPHHYSLCKESETKVFEAAEIDMLAACKFRHNQYRITVINSQTSNIM